MVKIILKLNTVQTDCRLLRTSSSYASITVLAADVVLESRLLLSPTWERLTGRSGGSVGEDPEIGHCSVFWFPEHCSLLMGLNHVDIFFCFKHFPDFYSLALFDCQRLNPSMVTNVITSEEHSGSYEVSFYYVISDLKLLVLVN